MKQMQLQAGLEDALDLLKQRIQLSKAVKSGARGMIEGSPTQSVPTYFVLSAPSMSTSVSFVLAVLTTLNVSPSQYSHRYSSLL